MTPLSPARKAAEEFASVVDGAHGELSDRYADLLSCVEVLREQEIPASRTDFVADLRMRLMDAADTLLLPADAELAPVTPLRVSSTSRHQRRVSIAAAAFVVIGGTAGVAAAAESSLPGDALYPLKRGLESAQVSLNSSDAGKGQDLLRQAGNRLEEVQGLLKEKKDVDQISSTLSAFRHSAASGADKLFVDYQRNGDAEGITNLRAMLGSQLTTLDSLATDAPAGASVAFEKARSLLSDLDQQASVLCGDCGTKGISDAFATSAKAPSLASLLSAPAAAAAATKNEDGVAKNNSDLADKADQIARDTPETTPPAANGANPPAGLPDGAKGLPLPSAPSARGLGDAVSGLTSGVSTLLQGVGGTALSPLTDAVDTTLDTLTKGLLGK